MGNATRRRRHRLIFEYALGRLFLKVTVRCQIFLFGKVKVRRLEFENLRCHFFHMAVDPRLSLVMKTRCTRGLHLELLRNIVEEGNSRRFSCWKINNFVVTLLASLFFTGSFRTTSCWFKSVVVRMKLMIVVLLLAIGLVCKLFHNFGQFRNTVNHFLHCG